MIGIGGTASGAIKLRPTVFTLWAAVGVAASEFVLDGRIGNAIPDIAEAVARIAYKLMAWKQLARWSDSHVFGSGSAAGNSFVNTRTML